SDDGRIQSWKLGDGQASKPEREMQGHTAGVTSLVLASDRRHILSASGDSTARVWDLDSGTSEEVLTHPDVLLWRATFANQGNEVLTAAADGNLRLWDPSILTVRQRFGAALRAARSSDSDILTSVGCGAIMNRADV